MENLDHGTWSMYEFEPGIERDNNFTTLEGSGVDEGWGSMKEGHDSIAGVLQGWLGSVKIKQCYGV